MSAKAPNLLRVPASSPVQQRIRSLMRNMNAREDAGKPGQRRNQGMRWNGGFGAGDEVLDFSHLGSFPRLIVLRSRAYGFSVGYNQTSYIIKQFSGINPTNQVRQSVQ